MLASSSSSPLFLLTLFIVGVGVGFMNALAGGGSLINLHLLMMLGLGPVAANGTVRFAILLQNLSAVVRYQRAGMIVWAECRSLLPPIIMGAGWGIYLAPELSAVTTRTLIGVATIGVTITLFYQLITTHKKVDTQLVAQSNVREHAQNRIGKKGYVRYAALFIAGLYGGVLQAGVGLLLIAILTASHHSVRQANVYKVVLALVYAPFAVFWFAYHGIIHWPMALALAIGQMAGSWLGAGSNMSLEAYWLRWIVMAGCMAMLGRSLWVLLVLYW